MLNVNVDTADVQDGNMAEPATPRYVHDTDVVVDYMVGSFEIQCNPATENTSIISSLYISDTYSDCDDDYDDDDDCVSSVGVVQSIQTDVMQLKEDILALTKNTFNFWQPMDTSLAGLESYFQEALEKLERAVAKSFCEEMQNSKPR